MRSLVAFALASIAAVAAHNPAGAAADNTLGMALMSAVVNGDGTLVRGAGITSAIRTGIGSYNLTFSRSLLDCTCVVSAGSTVSSGGTFGGIVATAHCPRAPENVARIHVTYDADFVDYPFHLLVFCNK